MIKPILCSSATPTILWFYMSSALQEEQLTFQHILFFKCFQANSLAQSRQVTFFTWIFALLLCKTLWLSPGSSKKSRCVSGMSPFVPCNSLSIHCPMPNSWFRALLWYIGKSLNADFFRSQLWWLLAWYVLGQLHSVVAKEVLGPTRMCLCAWPGWVLSEVRDALSPLALGDVAFSLHISSETMDGLERLKNHSCAWCQVRRSSILANMFAVWLCSGKCFRK